MNVNRYEDEDENDGFTFDVSPNQEGDLGIQLSNIPDNISEYQPEGGDQFDTSSLLAAPGSEIDNESQDGFSRERKLSDVENSLKDLVNEENNKIVLTRPFSVRINGNEVIIYTTKGSCVKVTITEDDDEKESFNVDVIPVDHGKKKPAAGGTLKRTREKDTENSVYKKQKTNNPLTDKDFSVPSTKYFNDLTVILSEPPLRLLKEDENETDVVDLTEELTQPFFKQPVYDNIPQTPKDTAKPNLLKGATNDPYWAPPMTPMSEKIWEEISRTPVRTFSMDLTTHKWK